MHASISPSAFWTSQYKNLHTVLTVWLSLAHTVSSDLCVCRQSMSLSQTKSVNVSIIARHVEHCPSGLWTSQETDVFRWHLVPVSSSNKKNKHLSGKAGDFFFLCRPHDVKQGLWSLSPYRTDTYRQREKKRQNIGNVENTKEVH